jgi:hypothetical protein
MIVGYYLSAHDNNSFFLEDEKQPDAPLCKKCGFLIDPVNYYNPYFLRWRKHPLVPCNLKLIEMKKPRSLWALF